MSPTRVALALNPGINSQVCCGVCPLHPPVNEFALQRGKEAIGHLVVISISRRAITGAHTHLFAAFAERHTGALGEFNRLSQHLNHGGFAWVLAQFTHLQWATVLLLAEPMCRSFVAGKG